MVEKPAYGTPCNGCGQCCQREPCALGAVVTGVLEGACPALERDGERFACGLVLHPARYAPVRAAMHGVLPLQSAAAWLVGAGMGCDWRKPPDEVFAERAEPLRSNILKFYPRSRELEQKSAAALQKWGVRCT